MKAIKRIAIVTLAGLLIAACVEHRPVRNGLRDESIYLTKNDFTGVPWLFKVTTVKASSPNVVGDYAFPGLESEVQLVNLRFGEKSMQILDGRQLQTDDPKNPDDDLATSTERVMLEFPGQHVDIKLRESLDGERTNYLEENTEAPWQERQKFKVELEDASLDPITSLAWFYGDFMHECASVVSVNLVPDSYELDQDAKGGEEHMTFVLEVNYILRVDGYCYDMVSLVHDAGTATIHYRFSFLRRAETDFPMEIIGEKAAVNKKYGAFQILNAFRDPDTGLLGGKSLLQRWDPNRTDPVVYYFHEGFPSQYKPMWQTIARETNSVLEAAGSPLRFHFEDHNFDGVERHLGDLRYSFVVWHQDIDTTRGLLGYGPSAVDPRTGEVISATVNLYNVGLDYYRFLIEDYLEEYGALAKPDPDLPWEEIPCSGETTTAAGIEVYRLSSTLFDEMRRVMEIEAVHDDPTDDFLPAPARGREAFLADYHRTLGEYRYAEPLWNAYVWRSTGSLPIENFAERMRLEREFQSAMESVLFNENPFGAVPLYTREGIEAQNAFLDDFRMWSKNHAQLEHERDMLFAMRNVYLFDESDAMNAIANGARKCIGPYSPTGADTGFWESDEQYTQRLLQDMVFQTAIHEYGHTLSLRHNFYGSADGMHMRADEVAASVMDYVTSWEQIGSRRAWGQYDEAALKWIYGGEEVRRQMMAEDFLYCTDEHRERSPLCQAHDLGVTPSQIVLNAIERYDWQYDIRNRRAFRTFWDTSGYVSRVYSSVFPLLRMWYLAIFDWGGGGVQDTLKRLDQVDPDRDVLTDQEYDEIAADFYNDAMAANGMIMAFYDAVINQSASFRNYQTEFDPFYGDILRLGIIIDKLYTTFAFMDLQDVWNYSPNIETYVAMYDAPFGSRNYTLAQRVLDNMLGSNYDTFPWFKYLALDIFAWATNSNLIDAIEMKDRIAIRRYETAVDLEQELGAGAIAEATSPDNPAQVFTFNGEDYAYTYLGDRGWHLVAGRSRSPVSFQFIKEYNEDLNAGASEDLDNYGLKILLAYYEYYNNFVGF